LKLQEEGRSPQVVAEFITATLTLLKRELSSLNHATISYSKSSEKFHQVFDSEWKQAVSVLNARAPIPEEFFSRIAADTHANSGEVAGRENKKVLWELFHQKMNDIVVAKNGLDVVVEGRSALAVLAQKPRVLARSSHTSRHEMHSQDGQVSASCAVKRQVMRNNYKSCEGHKIFKLHENSYACALDRNGSVTVMIGYAWIRKRQ
jgi:hypothetical protein